MFHRKHRQINVGGCQKKRSEKNEKFNDEEKQILTKKKKKIF